MRILEALRSVVQGSMAALGYPLAPRVLPAIHYDAFGVGVVSPARESLCHSKLCWEETVEVKAFKRDLFAVDLVCLCFVTSRGPELEVNEEMRDWAAFVEALPRYLPGCMSAPEILDAVIKPAFATNELVAFSRRGPV